MIDRVIREIPALTRCDPIRARTYPLQRSNEAVRRHANHQAHAPTLPPNEFLLPPSSTRPTNGPTDQATAEAVGSHHGGAPLPVPDATTSSAAKGADRNASKSRDDVVWLGPSAPPVTEARGPGNPRRRRRACPSAACTVSRPSCSASTDRSRSID